MKVAVALPVDVSLRAARWCFHDDMRVCAHLRAGTQLDAMLQP